MWRGSSVIEGEPHWHVCSQNGLLPWQCPFAKLAMLNETPFPLNVSEMVVCACGHVCSLRLRARFGLWV